MPHFHRHNSDTEILKRVTETDSKRCLMISTRMSAKQLYFPRISGAQKGPFFSGNPVFVKGSTPRRWKQLAWSSSHADSTTFVLSKWWGRVAMSQMQLWISISIDVFSLSDSDWRGIGRLSMNVPCRNLVSLDTRLVQIMFTFAPFHETKAAILLPCNCLSTFSHYIHRHHKDMKWSGEMLNLLHLAGVHVRSLRTYS